MAGTAPTPALVAVNDGDMLTAATLNSFGSNVTNLHNFLTAGFYIQKPIYQNSLAAAAGIANATNTVLSWPAPAVDNFGCYTSATPTFITIPKAGWWRLALLVKWDVEVGGGIRNINICINGTDTSQPLANDNRLPTPVNAEGTSTYCQGLAHLAQGATAYPVVNQTSGGTFNVVTAFGGTSFSAEWIAPY